MNRKILSFLFFFSLLSVSISAQNNKYWVFLSNKKDCSFNPYEYFDKKTIDRRIQYHIPLMDSTDFPLNSAYEQSILNGVDSVSYSSRWFNAIAVYATETQIEQIKQFPFVSSIEKMELQIAYLENTSYVWDTIISPDLMGTLLNQTKRMGGNLFQEKEIDGKGIRIAIFDGGFPTVDVNPAFEHIRKEGRIIKTWDFTKKNEFVYDYISHGTMVMSCIGGIMNGEKIGLATGAEFLLARTEVKSEPFSEEENWLAAVEWADKHGADIINSSLGYTYHRYFPNQMDGKTSLVAKAANMATRKGMLVVNAAGNDGDNNWKIVGTPADADSVLSVGGISPDSDIHTSFSSFGPTWDKRMKPNVCAYGHVAAAGKNKIVSTQGTSFASPLVAGFTACAWQLKRELNNMQLFENIQKSADLYPYFDYAHGYGVPQASYFISGPQDSLLQTKTFDFVNENDVLKVVVRQEFINQKVKGSKGYLYYHIQNADGTLKEYNVFEVNQEEVITLSVNDFEIGSKLNVHLGGYTATYIF